MNEHTERLVVGEYLLAVEGFAMIRNCVTTPSAARPRAKEIRDIVARFDELPYSLNIPLTEHGVEDGYTRWAPSYDGPNPAIALEQPIVGDYVRAFLGAGLSIMECMEPRVTDVVLESFPSYTLLPDATRQAFFDTPYLLVWRLQRPAAA